MSSELPPDLEAFLSRSPRRPTGEFREFVLDQTVSLVKGRRPQWHTLLLVVAGFAIVFLGSAGVQLVVRSLTRPVVAQPAAIVVPPAVQIPDAPPPTSIPDPAALEWQAFDSPLEKRAELYWTAGKAYVSAGGDYVSAVRCFRQALDDGPAELLQITDEDDVLTMGLKLERTRKEKVNVAP